MDALVVGALTALAAVVGMLLWMMLVRPERMLALFTDRNEDGWFEAHPGAVLALRLVMGVGVLLLGFLTGLIVSFLAGTTG